ncbi:ferredoxin [Pseudonocardia sp. ICBG601]|uniref:ferredoxin n=1 Tax=Pseudonocardia sp. ICBG601 TaxID=2846759 RepID=UPI001CF64B36|nr:ferredoxin [Pseudonocardia sp. ICBG601]
MKLNIDRDRCEGYGLCAEAAPQLMHLGDDGDLVLDVPDVPTSAALVAEEAVRVCPVAALRAR